MGVYDSLRNSMVGTQLTNNSNWQANKHQEEQQSSLSRVFDDIQDSIARSNEYGAPGHGFQGIRVNGKMAVSRDTAEAMGSEEELAQLLAQGITRRGGNY